MRINRSLLNWGVFLIALGGVPLAVQQGWADASVAGDLWRLWPLILVGIGLGLMLRWTPAAWLGGALVAGTFGLILGALIAGGISGVSSACIGTGSGESVTTEDSGVASGTTFELDLELSCGRLELDRPSGSQWTVEAAHPPDEPPSIESDAAGLSIRQVGTGADIFTLSRETRNEWRIGLPSTVAIGASLTLNAASGALDLGAGPLAAISGTFNAADLKLGLASVTTPAPAPVDLTLNAASVSLALPDASIIGQLTLNASSLEVCVPSGAEVRIALDSTLASDDLGSSGLTDVRGGWQTPGYDTATSRIDLSISSTVSSISLQREDICS